MMPVSHAGESYGTAKWHDLRMTNEVITVFRSRLRSEELPAYREVSERMNDLVRTMPGFVDAKTFIAADGERVTIVTFADEHTQKAWREHPEHRAAQRLGADEFYENYSITVGAATYSHSFQRGQ